MSDFDFGSIELELDEASTDAILKMLKEQDREHIDRVFAGEEGLNMGCSDGRRVELVPKPQWIPVEDRLPELPNVDGTRFSKYVLVIARDGSSAGCAIAFYAHNAQFQADYWVGWMGLMPLWKCTVTHWMPLPELPGQEVKNG